MKEQRVKVPLKELHDNPFKKEIGKGYIDDTVVEQLRENMRRTGVWGERIVARKNKNDKLEIVFGHHQLAAMRKEFGPSHEIFVHVSDYSDDQMLTMLINENNHDEMPITHRIDAVSIAQQRLVSGEAKCQLPAVAAGNSKRGRNGEGRQHEHGSAGCISVYLGSINWPESTVDKLLRMDNKLIPEIKESITAVGHDRKQRELNKGQVGFMAALELTKLDKESQRVAHKEIKESKETLTNDEVRRVVNHIKKESKDKPEPKLVSQTFKEAFEEKRLMMMKDGNAVARNMMWQVQRIASNREDALPKLKDMETLVTARDLIDPDVRRLLLKHVGEAAVRLDKFAQELSQPMKPLLKAVKG
jgi:hypothetical protein